VLLAFAGPANAVVDETGREAARQAVLVAAAGNDGPRAPQRHPAAAPWALAATAIDREGRAYARAAQGTHIAFAGPGVGIDLPVGAGRASRALSGTSLGAAYVAAAVALSGERTRERAVARLAPLVRDLGAPGRDPVFGFGLVQAAALCGRG
jgi:subtilisin family serine protease